MFQLIEMLLTNSSGIVFNSKDKSKATHGLKLVEMFF